MPKVEPVAKYETFESATYPVNRVEFFSKDPQGNPIYKTMDWPSGQVLIAQYRSMYGEAEGPPGSVQPHELALLVKAFGGDPTRLGQDKLQNLKIAEQEIANADKVVNVFVGNSGWIQSVPGMALPPGDYLWKFKGFQQRDEDGQPKWGMRNDREYALAQLEVDMPDSPFNGVVMEGWVSKATVQILYAIAPTAMEGTFGPLEDFPMRVANIAKNGGTILGQVGETPKGWARLETDTLRPGTMDDVSDTTGVPGLGYIEHLYQAIADGVDKKPWQESMAFQSPYNAKSPLADAGKAWAKANLAEHCKALGIPKEFGSMTEAHVTVLLNAVDRGDLAKLVGGNGEEAPW